MIEVIHKSEYLIGRYRNLWAGKNGKLYSLFEYGLCFAARKGRYFFMPQKTKEDYLELLRAVANRENRLPKKSDFSEDDVNRIKGFFGPWPWALEAAGLKDSKQQERKQRNYEKRQRAKINRKGAPKND